MLNRVAASKLDLGAVAVRRTGTPGTVRALAWIDDHVVVYYKTEDGAPNAERYEPDEELRVA